MDHPISTLIRIAGMPDVDKCYLTMDSYEDGEMTFTATFLTHGVLLHERCEEIQEKTERYVLKHAERLAEYIGYYTMETGVLVHINAAFRDADEND